MKRERERGFTQITKPDRGWTLNRSQPVWHAPPDSQSPVKSRRRTYTLERKDYEVNSPTNGHLISTKRELSEYPHPHRALNGSSDNHMVDFKEKDSILKGPTELRLEKKTQQMVSDMVSKYLRIPEAHETKEIEKMLNPVHYI
jgi:hypothetical protein